MPSMRVQKVETYRGACRLRLATGLVNFRCALSVRQHFIGTTPGLREAEGAFEDLPRGDAARAMSARKPLELELEDGRRWSIFVRDLHGSFVAQPLGDSLRCA